MRYKPNFSARMIAVMNVVAYHWELVFRKAANK